MISETSRWPRLVLATCKATASTGSHESGKDYGLHLRHWKGGVRTYQRVKIIVNRPKNSLVKFPSGGAQLCKSGSENEESAR
jgi:hypothetical protein